MFDDYMPPFDGGLTRSDMPAFDSGAGLGRSFPTAGSQSPIGTGFQPGVPFQSMPTMPAMPYAGTGFGGAGSGGGGGGALDSIWDVFGGMF